MLGEYYPIETSLGETVNGMTLDQAVYAAGLLAELLDRADGLVALIRQGMREESEQRAVALAAGVFGRDCREIHARAQRAGLVHGDPHEWQESLFTDCVIGPDTPSSCDIEKLGLLPFAQEAWHRRNREAITRLELRESKVVRRPSHGPRSVAEVLPQVLENLGVDESKTREACKSI